MQNSGDIKEGYCQCGCGKKTNIARKTNTRKGHKKGHPLRYLFNHHPKLNGINHPAYKNGRRKHSQGYIEILMRGHPKANRNYVLEHILVCERALGKYLPAKAESHHINGIRDDNRNSNLIICQDHEYHRLLHRRERALRECGHANWFKCPYCKKYDKPENLVIHPRMGRKSGHSNYHKECARQYTANRRASK